MFSGGRLALLLTLFGNRVSTEKPGFSVAGPCVDPSRESESQLDTHVPVFAEVTAHIRYVAQSNELRGRIVSEHAGTIAE